MTQMLMELTMWCFALMLAVIYMLPTFIAYVIDNRLLTYIAIYNLFLGWTVIGWVVAFKKALSE